MSWVRSSLVTDFLGESGFFSSQASGDGCPQPSGGSYPQGVALSRPSRPACWGLRGLPEGRIELLSGRRRCDRPESRMPRPRRRRAGVAKGRDPGAAGRFHRDATTRVRRDLPPAPPSRGHDRLSPSGLLDRPRRRCKPVIVGETRHSSAVPPGQTAGRGGPLARGAPRDGPAGPRTPQRGRRTLGTCLGGGSSSKRARRYPPARLAYCPLPSVSTRLCPPRRSSCSFALKPRHPLATAPVRASAEGAARRACLVTRCCLTACQTYV